MSIISHAKQQQVKSRPIIRRLCKFLQDARIIFCGIFRFMLLAIKFSKNELLLMFRNMTLASLGMFGDVAK